MKLKLLSVGNNQKLDKNIPVFNLPQGKTCPGATALCRKICYAAKAERMYPQAAAMRARNLIASKEPSFVARMTEEIGYLIEHRSLKLLRLHESGDFYNQDYLDRWIEIAMEEPEVTFLAYTKSFHLNFNVVPANMRIYASIDPTTKTTQASLRMMTKFPTAVILEKGSIAPRKTLTCTKSHDHHYCGHDCFTCWIGKRNVFFPQH